MKSFNSIRLSMLLLSVMILGACSHDVPFATRIVSMEYPRLAALARITGTVALRVGIDSTGKVVTAKGLSGHPILIKGAEANMMLWRFAPGHAASEFDFTYIFKLTGDSYETRQCSTLIYEYPDKVTIASEAPHWMP